MGSSWSRLPSAVPASGFRITASDGADGTGRMIDRVGATLWSTGHPQRGGEWVQVDLGAVVPVALVRWLPGTYQEVPRGLRLEASLDGTAWRTLTDLPEYIGPLYWSAGRPMGRVRSGRVELRVTPTPARHLRITQTGRSGLWAWTIRELYVYAATGPDAPEAKVDDAALARALRTAGVRRLYADHGWASRVALADAAIRVPPANLQLDDYGFQGSATMLIPPVEWAPGTGVLLEPADAEAFAEGARAGGLAFARHALEGGLTLFVHAPASATGSAVTAGLLRVSASRQPKRAGRAVDGDPATRWATAGPRAAGDWFRVDLAATRSLRGVRLAVANPADLPSARVVEGSPDGVRWERLEVTMRRERRYRWGGFALLDDAATAVRVDFSPTTLAALRMTLPAGDPVFDWSINELTVYGGE
jgi:hypothetical protein